MTSVYLKKKVIKVKRFLIYIISIKLIKSKWKCEHGTH